VLCRRAIPSNAGPVPVVSGELGASAELHGALLLALEHVDVSTRGATP